jgi:RNA polymerase II elongation factor ELL
VLDQIATPQNSNRNSYQLKNESYRELDPWAYPLYTPAERDNAIRNAIIAFDLLKLPKDAPERQRLISKLEKKDDKGKKSKSEGSPVTKKVTPDQRKTDGPSKLTPTANSGDDLPSKATEKKPVPKLIVKKPVSPSESIGSKSETNTTPTMKKRKVDEPASTELKKAKVDSKSAPPSPTKITAKNGSTDPTRTKTPLLIKTPLRDPLGSFH